MDVAPDLLDISDATTSLSGWSDAVRFRPGRREAHFGYLVSALDVLVLLASFGLAYVIRSRFGPGGLDPIRHYLWIGTIAVPVWLYLARATALTASHTYRSLGRALTLTLRVHVIASLALLSGLYLLKAVEVSRLLMQTFVVVSLAALVVERLAIHAALVRFADQWSEGTRRLLVVGSVSVAEGLQQLFRQRPHWRARVTAVVTGGPSLPGDSGIPVLGEVEDIRTFFDTVVFDEVVMADADIASRHGERVMSECVERGLSYHTLITMPVQVAARHHAEVLGDGVYLISLETTPQNHAALAVKRLIDVLCGAAGLVVCGLASLVIVPLIRLSSSGPAVFQQARVGRNGRRFTVYKFRSMRSDAEAERAALMSANEMRGHLFKLRRDPRVTLVGRILRRTYLDELPQFWNVVRGEMSLVGTRPPTLDEVANYAPYHRRRLSLRPGMTGLWQCQGKGRVSDFDDVVKLDCQYIDQWSLWLDIKIMARTLITVVRLSGQ